MPCCIVEGDRYRAVQVHGKNGNPILGAVVGNHRHLHYFAGPALLGQGGDRRPGGIARQVAVADYLHVVGAAKHDNVFIEGGRGGRYERVPAFERCPEVGVSSACRFVSHYIKLLSVGSG